MMLFFIGWAFVLLDVQIQLGNLALELLPDAVGYFLMFRALQADAALARLRPWLLGMTVLSAGLYIAGFWELSVQQRLVLWLLQWVELALCLWLLRRTVVLKGQEKTDRLKTLWGVLTAVHATVQLLRWLPLVGTVIGVAALVMSVCFLAGLYPALTAQQKRN